MERKIGLIVEFVALTLITKCGTSILTDTAVKLESVNSTTALKTFWMKSPKLSSLFVLSNVVFSNCILTCLEGLYACCPSVTDEFQNWTLLNFPCRLSSITLLFSNTTLSITMIVFVWNVSAKILRSLWKTQDPAQVILSWKGEVSLVAERSMVSEFPGK